jgi:hypothetical protein
MKRSSVIFAVVAMLLAQTMPASALQAPPPGASPEDQSQALSNQMAQKYSELLLTTCNEMESAQRLVDEMYQILIASNRVLESAVKGSDPDLGRVRFQNDNIRLKFSQASEHLQDMKRVCAKGQASPEGGVGSVGSTTPAAPPEQFRMPAEYDDPVKSLIYLDRWSQVAFNLHILAASRCDLAEMRSQRSKLETFARAAEQFASKVRRAGARGKVNQYTVDKSNQYASSINNLWKLALAQPPMNCPTAPEKATQVPSPPITPVPPTKGTQDCPSPGTPGGKTPPEHGLRFTPPDEKSERMLAAHNRARAEVGVPALNWDRELAAGAAQYAEQMSTVGRAHASREGRKCVRENLLQSRPGSRSPEQMVGVWLAEKASFKPGVFPDVSTTGDWAQVGHYTQIIWATTTHVGCATHTGAGYDWTVCRYTPPGNQDGKNVLGAPPVLKQPPPSGPVPIPYPSTQQPEPPTG